MWCGVVCCSHGCIVPSSFLSLLISIQILMIFGYIPYVNTAIMIMRYYCSINDDLIEGVFSLLHFVAMYTHTRPTFFY